MSRGRAGLRRVGRVLDRLTDNWLFDFLIGNWFDRPLDNSLDWSNRDARPRRRVYLDAEGRRMDPPTEEQPSSAPPEG